MKRIFTANAKDVKAATETSDQFNDNLNNLSDDYDYVADGLETLARQGKDGEQTALRIMLELNEDIRKAMKAIAENI